MSSHLAHLAIGATVVAAALASPVTHAAAQARPANLDSLRAEVRRLDSLASEQRLVVDSVRRTVVRSIPPVAIQRGPLQVRTVPALESRARIAVDSVARLVERDGGPQLASRVAAHVPVIRPDSQRALFGMLRVITIAADTTRRFAPRPRRPALASASARQLESELAGLIEQFAVEGVDSSLAAWVMSGRIPLRRVSSDDLADAYTEIATTQSAAIRRCRSGDNDACLDILGLDSLPGSRLERWYAPQDYRALLRTVSPPREDSAGVAAWHRCRERRDDKACEIVATAVPNTRIPIPLTGLARAILLREVLEAGGPGAYGRLVDASGPIRGRLEHAARLPVDTVVSRWRERMEQARPDRMTVAPGIAIASLGWSGALLGLTLIRRRSWV